MTPSAKQSRVWCMDYHNVPEADDQELYRWHIDKAFVLPQILRYVPRGTLSQESWPKDISVEAYSKGPLEDFPMTGANRPVVSERVKLAFEGAFPGLANYFAFEIKWRKKLVISERYFVCEWTKPPMECVNIERSGVNWIMGGTVPIVWDPVLDGGRLPSDRVASYEKDIMFNSVAWEPMRNLCLSGGFTGVRFEELLVV